MRITNAIRKKNKTVMEMEKDMIGLGVPKVGYLFLNKYVWCVVFPFMLMACFYAVFWVFVTLRCAIVANIDMKFACHYCSGFGSDIFTGLYCLLHR